MRELLLCIFCRYQPSHAVFWGVTINLSGFYGRQWEYFHFRIFYMFLISSEDLVYKCACFWMEKSSQDVFGICRQTLHHSHSLSSAVRWSHSKFCRILGGGEVVRSSSQSVYFESGEKWWGDSELMPKLPELLPFRDSVELSDSVGLIRFSFCRRLQYQTRTTSFSMYKLSASALISSLVGLGFIMKALSSETLTFVSIDVRFLRRRPNDSGVVSWLDIPVPNNLWAKNRRWRICPLQSLVYDVCLLCLTSKELQTHPELASELSASRSHFWSSGLSLHMFLKLRFNASKRDIVVCEKSFP